jgi:hypothetical protein
MRSLIRPVRLVVIALVALLSSASLPPVSTATAGQRFPVIGCQDSRYSFLNRWNWEFAPERECQPGVTLVGISHARWHSWGKKRATAEGFFIDGLGFQYPATITAFDLRTCPRCDGVRAPRAWYRFLHVVSGGGIRGGVIRGPFNVTLYVAPERRIITLGDFARQRRSFRVQFAVGYMTSHPDRVCYGGQPTPENVARNIAGAIADYRPGLDPGTGATISASEPIGHAVRTAESEIGC